AGRAGRPESRTGLVPNRPDGGRSLMDVEPMWAPSPERVERANITRYRHWLRDRRGLRFGSYEELWRWSVDDLDGFWTSIWEFFEVGGPVSGPTLAERRMPGARWFPEATLNHAELSLRRHDDHPALLFGNEAGELGTVGYAELGRRGRGCAGSGSPRATGSSPTCPTCPRPWSPCSPWPASAPSGRAAPPSSASPAWSTASPRSSPRCWWRSTATATAAPGTTAATLWTRSAGACPP